jgi:hypothetical protein
VWESTGKDEASPDETTSSEEPLWSPPAGLRRFHLCSLLTPTPTRNPRNDVAARVSRRGVGERVWKWGREKGTAAQPGLLSLSVRSWPRRGPSCPVPGDAWRAATAVLSTAARKEMRCKKTFLPLAGMQNHGNNHRTVLFVAMTTHSHVPSVPDLRVPRKAGPLISDCAGTSRRAMEG